MRTLANKAQDLVEIKNIEKHVQALATLFLHHGIAGSVKYDTCSTIISAFQLAISEDPECCWQFQASS